ncbi:DNA topoisomerase (ATP-hydrolyzing) subunit B [Patescibacteria group bacterium]|nr:MAG: DNA topoisomerase (ATP-hydrolyzing) subunit B [Patescibacteria group bacterium]
MAKNKEELNKKPSEYKAEQITVLEGLDPVRKRPGMYIGSTGPEGLHHLIWEVVDNSIDEAMAGYCKNIVVRMLPENRIEVEDDGRGIPVDIHKQTKKSALETVLTVLHAGGKFGGSGYKVSGGLHGVGVSVVNALSVYVKASVKREGKLWVQEYKRGKPLAKVKPVGRADGTGTTILFDADPEIFPKIEFSREYVLNHLRQQAYLTKGVKITVIDAALSYSFYFEGGIASYVKHLNNTKDAKHENIFYIEKEADGLGVEAAFQYTDDYKESVFTFANNIHTIEGGTHLLGFKSALTRTLNNYARKQGYLKEKDENLSGDDVREGLTAVISIKIREPQFEGQTKSKLGNTEARGAVESVVGEYLAIFLEEHPKDAEAIISKCVLTARARQAARAARDTILRKGVLEGLTLPGKLADCSSKDAMQSELFIVEGDSAGGSAKQGRNREFQAILPLKGKILNVERARIDKMLANNEVKSIIIALGTSIGEQFDISGLRYGRIVIMTDADVDGSHIRTLLLTLFYRYFKELIEKGHIYIAKPPLYQIKKGKEIHYVFSDAEKEKVVKDMMQKKAEKAQEKEKAAKTAETPVLENGAEGSVEIGETLPGGINIQRYKGLGEMNPGQLWETTLDPQNRVMKQVTIGEASEADKIFDILMGAEVAPRKHFIHTQAKSVKNLDI